MLYGDTDGCDGFQHHIIFNDYKEFEFIYLNYFKLLLNVI